MAILDASGAYSKIFDMADRELVVFFSSLAGGTSTGASWKILYDAPAGISFPGETATLIAQGQNFTYDLTGKLSGGELTSLSFFLGETGIIDSSVTFTSAIPLPIANLYTVGPNDDVWSAQSQAFWAALLSGDDTILAAPQKNTAFTGDFYQVVTAGESVALAGGNDTMSVHFEFRTDITRPGQATTTGSGNYRGLVGDAFLVEGEAEFDILIEGFLAGGDDELTMTGFAGMDATGDAYHVLGYGAVIGGDDRIVNSTTGDITIGSDETIALSGDVNLASIGSYVTGGDDRIIGSDYAFYTDFIAGDVRTATIADVTGGNDRLDGRGGQDRIAGDILTVFGGRITGGNDHISGGEDSDLIAGDIYSVSTFKAPNVIFTGGADILIGGNGNDMIAGDILVVSVLTATSKLTGGNDILFGGEGNDTLYGDMKVIDATGATITGGNDRLDGGNGDDIIDGQGGIDTALFNSVAAAVIADLVSGVATGQGRDTLAGIEHLTGSSLGDTLRGDGGTNRLDGGLGRDTLVGRSGRDVLLGGGGNDSLDGGAGNDKLTGGAGADTQTGGSGADIFIFGPALAGAAVIDRITDFADGTDKLDLSAFNFVSFSAVKALAVNSGGSLSIDLPGAETILITGLTFATFTAGDVIL